MTILNALIAEFVKVYGNDAVCQEKFAQQDPVAYNAIIGAYGTYAVFQEVVTQTKVIAPTVTTVKK